MGSTVVNVLLEHHSEVELQKIAHRLRVFRLYREPPYHGDGSERLVAVLPYKTSEALVELLSGFGLNVTRHLEEPVQSELGGTYTIEEMRALKGLIPGTRFLEQVGKTKIAESSVTVWCNGSDFTICVIPAAFVVTESDISTAESIEKLLANRAIQSRDPPVESERCLCPKYHPAYFG